MFDTTIPRSERTAPNTAPKIVVTALDLERLQRVITGYASDDADQLDDELARADVVEPKDVPADVVTMNSDVVYEDVATGARRRIRIVYPEKADVERGWVSVLAPLGHALLGLRVGQEIQWRVPRGMRRLRIIAVPYQPEASGDYDL